MPLSWNEIRCRAIEFSQEYKDTTRENAETQSFYNDFFNVFGISRRRVASFEEPVKKLGTKRGRIDLFWKGTLLVEHKSSGKDLDAAYSQALDYFPNLKEEDLPKYILISDFQHFELYDLETNSIHKFALAELHSNIELFGFIAGYQKRAFLDQDPVNIEASERTVADAVLSGETILYRATPIYQGSQGRPIGVTLEAQGSGGFSLYVSVLNRPKP